MTPSLAQILAIDLALLIGATTLLWVVSVRIKDASIIDIFWGLGFILAAWATRLQLGGGTAASLALPIAVTLWGTRLSLYLARRNLGHGEDKRYADMRAARPETFARWSLFVIFWTQATLVLIVALPVIVGQWAPRPADLGAIHPLEVIGWGIFLIGLSYQTVADRQLARFKADPNNRGRVMDRGLWRYSRHPNYFGEAVLWWGLYLSVLPLPDAWPTIIGPIVITTLLLKVSGVSLLERTIVERRPAYRDYIAKTNAFIPGRPKR